MLESEQRDVVKLLRGGFPHGHREFLPISVGQLALHSAKNHDYASGGSALGNFERVGAILGQYPNLSLADQRVIALVYMLKQVDAVLWGISQNITHKVEGLAGRLDDIAVYANIVQCMVKDAEGVQEVTGEREREEFFRDMDPGDEHAPRYYRDGLPGEAETAPRPGGECCRTTGRGLLRT